MELVIRLDADEVYALGKKLGASDVGSLQAALSERVKGILAEAKQIDADRLRLQIGEMLKHLDLDSLKKLNLSQPEPAPKPVEVKK